jgi:hypothetical protein
MRLSNPALAAAAALALSAAACGSDGDLTGDPANAGYKTNVNGSISGAISGSVANGEIWVAAVTGSTDKVKGVLTISAAYSPSSTTNQMNFTAPAHPATAVLISSIGFTGTPAAGTYRSSDTNVCGGLVAMLGGADGSTYMYAAVSPNSCDSSTVSDPGGAWTLTLSSVSQVAVGTSGAQTAYAYAVHGTLTGTLSGAKIDFATFGSVAGTSTVSLSF